MENEKDTELPPKNTGGSSALLKPLRAFFAKRNVRLPRNIPLRVLAHARRIILSLEKGREYTDFKGKRLMPERNLISIPVGRNWRLLAEWQEGKIVPSRLLSHQTYNYRRQR